MSKLYATVSSEKATKGQGGQEFINIKLTVNIGGIIHELGIVRMSPLEAIGSYVLSIDRSSVGRDRGGEVYREVIDIKD